ncbi:MAG: cupin domain-containing protein [Myxococcales bacterium]|nr:MAG: cupin domain-containing protein [Myxococcales bacterium]
MNAAEVTNLANLTAYVANSIISRTLVKNEAGNLTYMAFGAGQGLSKHSAPFDAFVQALDGKATIVIDEKGYELSAGDAIIMPANVPHAIQTKENFKMLLVMLKNQS